MSNPLSFLVDKAIRAAEADGAFENLPGSGKPLADLHVPGNAVIDRMLKEAKAKPPVVVFKAKIIASQERLRGLKDPEERKEEMQRLADLQTRLAIEQEALRRFG
ncbi:DnaJ family domain-containing protein [Tropicimonas sp. TH_r6]|uniref:DnaJ family domain-containing protein n=1 Tax=Tropicimonas sp. TH_r6 TaxID=3082085 RepID=UPI002953C327|nr:DnaJ family domain-containing protein [Tropicimonas sp. TH_r6]MDV7145255.1 DnaJ family domain-containing protein [Tropicimonas sp. TH_r6]